MNLSAAMEEEIKVKVVQRGLSSPEELLRRALDALDEIDREDERIRQSVRRGVEEYERGEAMPADEVFERLRAKNAAFRKRVL
jgi:predicted transcriptional regulator